MTKKLRFTFQLIVCIYLIFLNPIHCRHNFPRKIHTPYFLHDYNYNYNPDYANNFVNEQSEYFPQEEKAQTKISTQNSDYRNGHPVLATPGENLISKTDTMNEQILALLRLLQEGTTRRYGDLTETDKKKLLIALIPCLIPVIYLPFLWITSAILFYPLNQIDEYIRNEEKKIPVDVTIGIEAPAPAEEGNRIIELL